MNHFFESDLAPLVALASVLCAIFVEVSVNRGRRRRRAIQLKTANDLLKQHFTLLQKFIEEAAAPPKLKERLLIFSDFIADENSFLQVVREVCDPDFKRGNDSEAKGYVRDLLQLRAQDTDLAEMFAACIKSGVAAMMLRSSGANDLMEATMARVYSSPRKEGELFAGAMKKNRADRNRGNAAEMKPALA